MKLELTRLQSVDAMLEAIARLTKAQERIPLIIADLNYQIRLRISPRTMMISGSLSPQQERVFECLQQRLSNKEIARALGITERTVKFHVSLILQKYGVKKRWELYRSCETSSTSQSH